jgi:drug/metabolite transporter (DMT)-like permease
VIVVILALGATSLYGTSSVLMHSKARGAPAEQSLRLGLLVHLARQPVWLAGVGTQLAGFGLQATALEMGSLSVVQALGPIGLLLALPLAARVSGKRLGRTEWAGAVATVGGLAAFLAIAAPGTGRSMLSLHAWSALFGTTLVITGALVMIGRRRLGPPRAVALGTAAGVVLALTAAVTKVTATQFRHGLGRGLTSWELYVLIALGLAGMLLMQSSFQAGNIEWSLPALTASNPVVSVIVGTAAFHEGLTARGLAVLTLPVTLSVALIGIVLLARSPALVAIHEEAIA